MTIIKTESQGMLIGNRSVLSGVPVVNFGLALTK